MLTRIHIFIILGLTSLYSLGMELSVSFFQCIPLELHPLITQNFAKPSDISALCQANTFFSKIYNYKKALTTYPHLHATLTQKQYLSIMVQGAQTKNYSLLRSLIDNENNDNKQVRNTVLDFFDYPSRPHKKNIVSYTKNAFSGIARHEDVVDSAYVYLAVVSRNPFALAVLYKNNANINTPGTNETETTPLAYTIKKQSHSLTEQLLSYGCKTDTCFAKKNSLLHVACMSNNHQALQLLLEKEPCKINATNAQGDTPLHLAVVWEDFSCAKLLLEQPCTNIFIKNKDGETAFDLIYVPKVKNELQKFRHSATLQQAAKKRKHRDIPQKQPQSKRQRKK